MHLTLTQWMRETASDTSDADWINLFNAIKEGDLFLIGMAATRMFQPAIDAYEEQEQETGESEAAENKRLFNAMEARAIR